MESIFSVQDLRCSLTSGEINGLVFVPWERAELLLLLVQFPPGFYLESAAKDIHNRAYRTFWKELVNNYRQTQDGKTAWIKASVAAFSPGSDPSANSIVQCYQFPFDCTEKDFFLSNQRKAISPCYPPGRLNFKGPSAVQKTQIAQWQQITRVANDLLANPHLESFLLGEPIPNPMDSLSNERKDKYFELLKRGGESVKRCLKNRISLKEEMMRCLVHQLVTRNFLEAELFGELGYYALPKELERVGSLQLFTIADLSVKLNTHPVTLKNMLAAGKLIPDFILQVGAEVEYVFLEIPRLDNSC
ncbi:MAG: hypothetical protein ABIH69_00050 [bacterium]|nr:hypothetical protein [Candidatus Margulisiibacteriota bacterium]